MLEPAMHTAHDTTKTLSPAQILRWYVDMGVDIALDEMPHDRLAEGAALAALPRATVAADEEPRPRPALLPPRPAPQAGPAVLMAGPEAGIPSARALAAAATTLGDLRAALESLEGCALKTTATRLVFADGNPQARIMLVGEAPGADEDRTGIPFAGKAGHLLDKMLAAIGLDRTSVYLASTIPWRPPGNRPVTPAENAMLLPFIVRHIELAAPALLVCMGGTAVQTLLESREGILRARGKWFGFSAGGREIPALAMLHPAYLLNQPVHKRRAWQDLLELRQRMEADVVTKV